MRPAGNENKGAMKLRVDFKKKHPGDAHCFCHSQIRVGLLTVIVGVKARAAS